MADEVVIEKNPFEGMTFGQGVRHLRENPDLSSKFDARFGDEEEVDLFTRARLHATNSYYRNNPEGALSLKLLADNVTNPPVEQPNASTPATEAQDAWAQRLRGQVKRGEEFKPLTQKDLQKEQVDKYNSILDDLAQYEHMRAVPWHGSGTALEGLAAVGGAIAGGIPSITNVAGLPIRGASVMGRLMWGGGQNAALMGGADLATQTLNINAGIHKEYDPLQTVISAGLGAVIGGGVAGIGELITKKTIFEEVKNLAKDDVSLRTPNMAPERVPESMLPKEEPKSGALVQERQAGTQISDEPIPSPNYARPPEAVKSLQKMVTDLEESFGVPIRQGEIAKNKTLGTYNPDTGVIRLQEFPDFSVAAHEVGHAVHQRGGKELDNLITNTHSIELGALDYEPVKARDYEGYAEFIRLFMTNPAAAQKRAPGFYNDFVPFLTKESPETIDKLVQFQQAYKNYLDATPKQIVLAGIVTPTNTWPERALNNVFGEKIAPTIRNVMMKSYDALISRNEPIYRTVRAIGQEIKDQTGKLVDILPSDDPRILFEGFRKAGQTAMSHIMNGVTPYGEVGRGNGVGLAQSIARAHDKNGLFAKFDQEVVDNFAGYIKAKRGDVLWDKYNRGDLEKPPTAESQAYQQEVVKLFDKEHPQFAAAAQMFHDFHRAYLDRRLAAGTITQHYYDEAVKDPFYAPYMRDRSDLPKGRAGEGMGGKQTGSMRDVINPITASIDNAMAWEREIARTDTVRALVNFSKRAGHMGGQFVEPLSAYELKAIQFDGETAIREMLKKEGYGSDSAKIVAEDFMTTHFTGGSTTGTAFKQVLRDVKKDNIVLYKEAGEYQGARIISSDERQGFGVFELLETLPPAPKDLALQLLGLSTATLTTTVVTHPVYMMRNLFRDQFAASVYIPGYIPFISAIKGGYRTFGDSDIDRMYTQFAGVSPGSQLAPVAEAAEKDIKMLAGNGYSIVHNLAEAFTFSEKATRLGAFEVLYKQKLRQGLSEYDAAIASARETSDLLDFGRFGSHTEAVRNYIPFINAYIQSMDKLRRSITRPVYRELLEFFGGDGKVFASESQETKTAISGIAKIWAYGGALGFMTAALFWDKQGYRDRTPAVGAANVVIPLGDDKLLLLPKPWELAMGFTAMEYAYARLVKDDPRWAEQLAEATWDTFKPTGAFLGNPLVKTVAELITGTNTFTGGPIVPERLKGLSNDLQYTNQTSSIAKRVSEITGWSPRKVDHTINNLTGYWGRDLTTVSNGLEDETMTDKMFSWALTRSGVRDPALLSDAREKFWKRIGRTTGDYSKVLNDHNALMKDPAKHGMALERLSKLPANKKAWVILYASGSDESGKQTFTPDERRSHPFTRAADAVMVLNGFRDQIDNNRVVDPDTKQKITLTPDQRKKLSNQVSLLGLAEMSNALIITSEPGYKKEHMADPAVYLKQIEAVSPAVAEELKQRYATKKIYRTQLITEYYDKLQKELVASGSKAVIKPIADAIVSEGYEFGVTERRSLPRKRRTELPGAK